MKTIYKLLQVAVKLCSLSITIPVTIETAGILFAEVPAFYRVFVQVSAVVLVELTLLASWLALETDKQAPTAVKVRHAITALGLYVGLTVLAIFVHREGLIAGMLFRFAMLAALVGSIYDSGVYTVLQGQRQAERNIGLTWRVRRHQKRLAVKDAIAELDMEYASKAQFRANRQTETSKTMEVQHKQAMQAIVKPRDASTEEGPHSFPFPIEQARDKRQGRRLTQKAEMISRLQAAMAANPALNKTQLGAALGISRQTVSNYLAELQGNENAEQLTYLEGSNGNGTY